MHAQSSSQTADVIPWPACTERDTVIVMSVCLFMCVHHTSAQSVIISLIRTGKL